MSDPAFDDGVFVQSWILMDFPFGPRGQASLDYFEEFLKGTGEDPHRSGNSSPRRAGAVSACIRTWGAPRLLRSSASCSPER